VRTALESTPGVEAASVDFASGTATVTPAEGFDLNACLTAVNSLEGFNAKL
jgi:copper chaperone CopZ